MMSPNSPSVRVMRASERGRGSDAPNMPGVCWDLGVAAVGPVQVMGPKEK